MTNVISQWNNVAKKYAEDQENSVYVKSNRKIVKDRFAHLSGENVLDLGCGYGFFTDYFNSIGAKAIGIDASENMIEIARNRFPQAEFSVMDINTPLAFENNRFDIVFSNLVLMDVENIDFIFSECKRILKAGGILYYSIVHPAFFGGYWLKNEDGYKYGRVMEKYIEPYHFTNRYWGETEHFHRSLSYYLNLAAKYGFVLRQTWEPISYDSKIKNSDLPVYFFAEYINSK